MKQLINSLLASRLVRYVLVGGFSFVVDYGILALLHLVFGLPVWLSTALAFAASFVVNYLLQRAFAFQSDISHGPGVYRYSVLVVFNFFTATVLVSLLDTTGIGWSWGKVITTGLSTCWNFFLYKYWVFPEAASEDPAHPTQPEQERDQ